MKIDNKASNGKLALGSPFLYFSTSKAYSHDVLGNIWLALSKTVRIIKYTENLLSQSKGDYRDMTK